MNDFRDLTYTCYNRHLWISEILKLPLENDKFIYKHNNESITIQYVSVFGEITEKKTVGEKGVQIVIEDGTGKLQCMQYDFLANQWEPIVFNECSKLSTTLIDDKTVDDSVFNDKTMQTEELQSLKDSRSRALNSLWTDSLEMISQNYEIWDTVCVYGKLYSYFNQTQLHVNAIRRINEQEELVLLKEKLEDGFAKPKSKARMSGRMTFDNICENPRILSNHSEIPTVSSPLIRPLSPATPLLNSAITFDTATQEQSFNSDDDLFV